MYLRVSDGTVELVDHENFKAFKVVIAGAGVDLDAARKILAAHAELPDASTAWVFQGALRSSPVVADDSEWQARFAGMIEKARPHGWIDDARGAVKAHVEWASATI